MKHTIRFLPMNKVISAEEGDSLLKVAADNNILINASCAGSGSCGKCKVKLNEEVQELTHAEKRALTEEEIKDGYRLACQIRIFSSFTVILPEYHKGSQRKKALNRLPKHFVPDVSVKKYFLKVPEADMMTQKSLLDRIRLAAQKNDLQFPFKILSKVQETMKKSDGKITVTISGRDVLEVEPGDTSAYCYGMSIDIGTTTIVTMLWDLEHCRLVDTEALTNPQSTIGADVISRIAYCMEKDKNTKRMQKKGIDGINLMIEHLIKRNGIDPNYIYSMTVVGNTTMSHLFLGIDPDGLARFPFAPAIDEGVMVKASDLGIQINPMSEIYVLPNIAGHVGSDITAVMLTTDIFSLPGNTVIIDIGTNGEIMAASDGTVKACSTAAGPAFEGSGIQYGMRAYDGAIERVAIDEDVRIQVIGGSKPVGICGSGIIDAVAALLQTGIISKEGNFISPEEAREMGLSEKIIRRIYESDDYNPGIVLAENETGRKIVVTQKDIREIQLAKSAILSGIKTLLDKLKIQEKDIDRIYIAGAFGSYINKKSAVIMGLLPEVDPDKIISIGNAAGTGASMTLLSKTCRKKAERQTKCIQHVELSQDMDFQKYYIDCMFFPQSGNNEN